MANTSIRLYDSHAHLVSDDYERYPQNPPDFDTSTFPPGVGGAPGGLHGKNPINLKPTAQQMHLWMLEENVSGMAAVQKGLLYQTDNRYIVDASELYPNEMKAVIIIDPREEKTLPLIREYSSRNVAGIRFFGLGVENTLEWLSSNESQAVWALANELGLIVDVEAPGESKTEMLPFIVEMASKYEGLNVVLDHLFLPRLSESNFGLSEHYQELTKRNNIFYKWTSINMDACHLFKVEQDAVLRAAVDFFGADKIMWGSDIGTSSGTYKDMVSRAIDSTRLLSDEERRLVLHDNGNKLFNG